MSDTVGSEPSPGPDASARGENAALRQLSEKAVMRISQMKRALMEKTVAFLAEQQLRRSAESRLGAEMRKAIKLAAHNQQLVAASAKMQQQQSKLQHLLKDAKAEVERLSTENSCLRTSFKDFAEGLQAELQQFDMDTQALSTGVKERVYKLLSSSSEMFQVAPYSAAEDSTQGVAHARPSSSSSACAGPVTPERGISDASAASSALPHDELPHNSNVFSTSVAPSKSHLAVSLRTTLMPSQAASKATHAKPLPLQSGKQEQERSLNWRALPAPSAAEGGGLGDERARMHQLPALQDAPSASCSTQQLVLRKPLHRHSSSASSMEMLSPISVASFPLANKDQESWHESPSSSHSQLSGEAASPVALPASSTGRGHYGWASGTKGKGIGYQGGGLPSSHDEPFYSPRNPAAEEQEDSFAEDFPSFSRQIVRRRSPPRSFLLSVPDGR